MNPTSPAPESEEILDALRPRMRQARIAHVRRLIAGLAVVPLLGIGAAAMAVDGADAPATQTASPAGEDAAGDDAPEVALPDIGEAGGDEAEVAEPEVVEDKEPEAAEIREEEQTKVLSLGPIGAVEVEENDDGGVDLVETDLVEGWEIINIEIADGKIVIVVKKGDSLKAITIKEGVRDEIEVKVVDVVIPTTTTTTTTVKPEPEPEPGPVVERIVVEVPGKGSFVVEREGETLYLGNVQPNEGYDYEIHKAEGWKVYVSFTNGEWRWYGKALINDFGQIETQFWDEEVQPDPVYQWVEVPGVGAVKFKLWHDGLVYVKEWTSECCGVWDYNQGAGAEVAKVDFEGEGTFVIVEAWGNEAGTEIVWEISDQSPPPEEEPPPTTTTEPPPEEPAE